MTTEKHISLAELLSEVKSSLAERFPLGVWISAEIGELKENRYSGHCYLELIEKGPKDGIPKAKVSAAIWRSRWGMIESHFRALTGRTLEAGMSVLLKVSVTFHEVYGLSLVINDIDPAYTLGENEQRKREVIAALEADGVMELNKQLALPAVVQRVAVISSATAAGLQDFRHHIDESPYRIETTLFEAIMQGSSAEESIISALACVAEREDEFDAVAIIRGGGSQSDLDCFNSYLLSSHIAQFPLPVLTGIGHDKDSSVADMVACRALKTPTAVADFLVAMAEGFLSEAESAYEQILLLTKHSLATHSSALTLAGARLASHSSSLLSALRVQVERAQLALEHHSLALVEKHLSRLAVAESLAATSSPERILRMGFAVVRSEGKILTSADEISEGQRVEITLAKGGVGAVVTKN
jgi:exodeoxyribonuclease VII large subunit